MNYPGPGWPQGNPPGSPPGYPGYGPAGYPPSHPGRPSTAPAYLATVLFGACSVFSFVLAFADWDGNPGSVSMPVAVIGAAFSGQVTGNLDFGISATMTVACTVATFTVLLAIRLAFARWILAAVAAIVAAYYIFALIKLFDEGGGRYSGVIVVALLLWLGTLVVALLPQVTRAMRGYRPRPVGYWR